ncbi:MAG TPA: hypothetical protein VFW96_07575 [Thermomicrobiales bacterium]|nr:hypothetical protein [Thermomicrobiales bacterium]
MGAIFDWSRISSVPYQDEILGPGATTYLVVFVVVFLAAALLYWRQPARWRDDGLLRRVVQRVTLIFLWVTGVGLVFFAFRILGLPLLGIRLWLWIMTAAFLAAIAYVAYYFVARYPAERAAYDAAQAKRRYQHGGHRRPAGAAGPGAPVAPRSARAEKRRQRSTARNR